jgi:hypothetical protein
VVPTEYVPAPPPWRHARSVTTGAALFNLFSEEAFIRTLPGCTCDNDQSLWQGRQIPDCTSAHPLLLNVLAH